MDVDNEIPYCRVSIKIESKKEFENTTFEATYEADKEFPYTWNISNLVMPTIELDYIVSCELENPILSFNKSGLIKKINVYDSDHNFFRSEWTVEHGRVCIA